MAMKDGYEENETARACPPLDDGQWLEKSIDRGTTQWPELPIGDDEPYADTVHYRVLKGRYYDPDDEFGKSAFGWPPRDRNDHRYPLDWFEYTDLNERGRFEYDDNFFPIFKGTLEPDDIRCGTVVNWNFLYPEDRYCGRSPAKDSEYCHSHRGRDSDIGPGIHENMDAEELVQTGLFAQTVDHAYEGVGPYKRVFSWGLFASLMGESTYEFAPEKDTRHVDFSAVDIVPAEANDDDIVEVTVKYPTQHIDPALSLFNAAVDTVKMLNVQPRLLDSDNGGVMSTTETTNAQLTAPPSEHDPSPQEWRTIEETKEHPLNLPYSRLISDREDLLKRGGIVVDPEEDDTGKDDIDISLDVTADPEVDDKHDTYGSNEDGVTKDIAAKVDDSGEYETS